ncbi:tripartite tricarboxylate transporter permease [Propylenella binzhouense]|uniref:C4-dicarboxylate ABC transporter permease n=1 Tax=Propylenella binzhouense TaxID=2555902 RepID=A0A964T391_9HYPH|nr:tripartite tricarboxylate transporter permease [Propylenella binzhouense]MYZ47114.1 C4-dicarboxylate ABC transporter permease [Propylenella binzhouense]
MDLISAQDFAAGLSILLDPYVHVFLIVGAFVGMVFGAAPGLTAPAAVALMLPLTYGLGLNASLALLLGIYCSGYFAGSIPAILINTPGTPGNAATALDGYQMAKLGEGDRAITTAIIASFLGGLVSMLLLSGVAPVLAQVALSFTSVEYFSLALLGIVCVAGISTGSLLKGCAGALIGIFISTVGLDPTSGVPRFTFGIPDLLAGIPLIPALIGLFAISEMLMKSFRSNVAQEFLTSERRASVGNVVRDFARNKWLALKSALMGTFIGLLPGTGPAIASWVAYGEALRTKREGDKFGHGEVKGVIACEVSNNAVTGGAMIPLLTLGIPGDPVTAILIGALMIQGIEPGPFFIRDHGSVFISILILLFVSNIWMVVLGLMARRGAAQVVRVPAHILVPTISVLAAAGGFAINSSSFDVMLTVLFGGVGFLMVRYHFPVATVVLGLVLGPILESNLRNALVRSDMDPTVFFTRPISAAILLAIVVLLFVWGREDRRQRRLVSAELGEDVAEARES